MGGARVRAAAAAASAAASLDDDEVVGGGRLAPGSLKLGSMYSNISLGQARQHVLDQGGIDIGEWSALAQDNTAAVAADPQGVICVLCMCAHAPCTGRRGRDHGVSISTFRQPFNYVREVLNLVCVEYRGRGPPGTGGT